MCKYSLLIQIHVWNIFLSTYIGDGSNDFCPILKLSPADLAFVRQGYALEKTISKMKEKENLEVKASIYLWQNAHDIMKIIQDKVQIKITT